MTNTRDNQLTKTERLICLMGSEVSVNGWLPGHLAFSPMVSQFIAVGMSSEVSERGKEGRREGMMDRRKDETKDGWKEG